MVLRQKSLTSNDLFFYCGYNHHPPWVLFLLLLLLFVVLFLRQQFKASWSLIKQVECLTLIFNFFSIIFRFQKFLSPLLPGDKTVINSSKWHLILDFLYGFWLLFLSFRRKYLRNCHEETAAVASMRWTLSALWAAEPDCPDLDLSPHVPVTGSHSESLRICNVYNPSSVPEPH